MDTLGWPIGQTCSETTNYIINGIQSALQDLERSTSTTVGNVFCLHFIIMFPSIIIKPSQKPYKKHIQMDQL